MSEEKGSISLTAALCAALFGLNYVVLTRFGFGPLSYLLFWPVAFALCAWIAGRFFRGHGSL